MSRIDRINEEIRFHISTILQRDLRDPRVGFVTITKVDTSPDLRSASIYFTSMQGRGPVSDTLKGLKASKGFIRSMLAKRMDTKFIPQITFIDDVTSVEKNRIDEIIDIIHAEKEMPDGNDGCSKDNKEQ
jgi:ribosome-binding factor A